VVTVTGDGQLCIPKAGSEQVKVTVTLVLFQPFAFGWGDIVAEIAGGITADLKAAHPSVKSSAALVNGPFVEEAEV
jgi:hypothetical protein